ncbi:hypothetical protein Desti_0739 [Desulfomonile tiedjei DSM 6799]|uniref:Uncharacterized protein n=1 Tax=Desulfomonile tiedjei (strain ATCC 49306 / DSM 6799 / DCB-1) TaxID=706587 RepID=I4C1M3_DESTA|nr:hypothetical protein Desti_0739 [Desulfomonile tiedjei DSM 6799]
MKLEDFASTSRYCSEPGQKQSLRPFLIVVASDIYFAITVDVLVMSAVCSARLVRSRNEVEFGRILVPALLVERDGPERYDVTRVADFTPSFLVV